MPLIVKNIARLAAAGIVAFLMLCAFGMLYYNPSSHLPSPTGATDYIREPNSRYAYMSEGYSFGRTDSGGFNNPGQMAENSDAPDILFMGSSHMEAMYVSQYQSAPHVLNDLLRPEGMTVYSIAMSAHNFIHCLNNLDQALKSYQPKDYVIIEMMSVTFGIKEIEDLLAGRTARESSYSKDDWQYWIQQPPYLKLLYNQYRNTLKESQKAAPVVPPPRDDQSYQARVEEMIALLCTISANHNVLPILFFHPALIIQEDGSAGTAYSREDLALLSRICAEQGVEFVDMTDVFLDGYDKEHVLPHGFSNTEIGTGHINRYGHRMVAEELYEIIKQKEAAG